MMPNLNLPEEAEVEAFWRDDRGTVIDLHSHVFNVLFLPARGIFRMWTTIIGMPLLGIGVAAALELLAIFKSRKKKKRSLNEVRAVLSLEGEPALREAIVREIPSEALDDEDVRKAIRQLERGKAQLRAADASPRNRGLVEEILNRLFLAFEPAIPASVVIEDEEEQLRASRALVVTSFLRWVWLMTEPEETIAGTLSSLNSDCGLFIHHMMDMEKWYPRGGPFYKVASTQQTRMRYLEKTSNGRLLGFVAFDPRRGAESLRVVKSAIDRGAIGVKVYPPNGYKPIGNKDQKIDPAMASLFDYCDKQQVPILTHCTPSGFEAKPLVSGCNADPEFWRPVLGQWETLRLCFGHGGGEAGWTGATKRTRCEVEGLPPFAHTVAELCRRYPNVYCELAFFGGLKAQMKRDALAKTLYEWTTKDKTLQKKICYGTDWHMPGMYISTAAKYLEWLRDVFSKHDLPSWKDRFFRLNAIEFLRLKDYVTSNPLPLPPAALATLQHLIDTPTT